MLDKLRATTIGLNRRFSDGNEPFQIIAYYDIEKVVAEKVEWAYQRMKQEGLISIDQ